jgi:hypothetical protein
MVKPSPDERAVERLRAYRRRRLQKSKSQWSVGEIATGVIGAMVVSYFSTQDLWQNVWLPFLGFVAGAAVWHWILHPAGRFIWTVPEQEHIDLWRDLDDQRTECAALQGEVSELRKQMTTTSKDPAVVNALLPQLKFAVHELANRVTSDDTWKTRMKSWERQTEDLLKGAGCTEAEIASFSDFTGVDLGRIGGPDDDAGLTTRRQRWVQFRIDALRRIINHHSDRQVFD